MILLDSDHLTVLGYLDDPKCAILTERLDQANDPSIATTIITFEEQMRGWMAEIHRQRQIVRQVVFYARLAKMVEFFKSWTIARFEASAAEEFMRLRGQRIRIGAQDLKIASIALVKDALLLSANLRDFRQVPGLRVENWLQ
ncbi:MAG: type II toxin-antitoxin system VapC family toxin [Gemmataceae bacterium]|nr:type II toxin-antitoxin system VapC family toxin [Gemmataceae bacterium]MCI0739458.1 type II toxin-antitoxin system VapC family toxin [Gemmataceae bacterium]